MSAGGQDDTLADLPDDRPAAVGRDGERVALKVLRGGLTDEAGWSAMIDGAAPTRELGGEMAWRQRAAAMLAAFYTVAG
jgi:hypothetical protein